MADGTYYVRSRGRVSGPFDLSGLQKLIRRGQLSRSDQVSSDKSTWSSAGEFEELFPMRGAGAVATAATGASPTATGDELADASQDSSSQSAESLATSRGKFYYSQSGATVGPLPLGVLRSLAQNGTLRAGDMVWQDQAEVAVPASQVTHLADIYSTHRPHTDGRHPSPGPMNPALVDKSVRAASAQVTTAGTLVAGLILLLLMLPVVRFKDRTIWWWDALGQSHSPLFSITLVYHFALAVAIAIVVPLTKGLTRSIAILSLAGVGLTLWVVGALGVDGPASLLLLALSSVMIPISAGALLAVLRFRALQMDSNRGRLVQGVFGGLLAVFSAIAAITLLVGISDGIGPVPGWVVAVIVMVLVGAVAGIAGAVLALVGSANRYSHGVNLAGIVCCILAMALYISCTSTAAFGVANMAAVLGELGNALGDTSLRNAGINGWIAFCLIRLVIIFYGLIVLLGSGVFELLVSICARELQAESPRRTGGAV